MRTLAIETATEACSIALFDGDDLLDAEHRVLGRGHAERLIPMIAALPDKGRADRILVSLGPGSFTGVRIGIAAARALGFAWSAQVMGYPTLALVCAVARSGAPGRPCSIAMKGGHGEVFAQDYGSDGLPQSDLASLSPADAAATLQNDPIVGTAADIVQAVRATGAAEPLHPDARHVFDIPDALVTKDLSPIYGRPPDAKPATGKPATGKPAKG